MALLSLANELLEMIALSAIPGNIEGFALSCSRLYHCASAAIKIHNVGRKIRDLHDRDALVIPSALKAISKEPRLAWYIERIVIWGTRANFSQWVPFANRSNDHPSTLPPLSNALMDHAKMVDLDRRIANSDTFFSAESLKFYEIAMRDVLRITEDQVVSWMSELRAGDDEPMKILLAGLAKNLSTLVIVQHDTRYLLRYVPGTRAHDGWTPRVGHKHPLTKLRTAIHAQAALEPSKRLCFQSLKEVHLQHVSEYDLDAGRFDLKTIFCMSFLALPALEKLVANGSGWHDNTTDPEEEEEVRKIVPQHSSSIKHLVFNNQNAWNTDTERIMRIVQSAAALTSLQTDQADNEELIQYCSENGIELGYPQPISGDWDGADDVAFFNISSYHYGPIEWR